MSRIGEPNAEGSQQAAAQATKTRAAAVTAKHPAPAGAAADYGDAKGSLAGCSSAP